LSDEFEAMRLATESQTFSCPHCGAPSFPGHLVVQIPVWRVVNCSSCGRPVRKSRRTALLQVLCTIGPPALAYFLLATIRPALFDGDESDAWWVYPLLLALALVGHRMSLVVTRGRLLRAVMSRP